MQKTRIDTKTTDRTLLEKTFEKSDVAKGQISHLHKIPLHHWVFSKVTQVGLEQQSFI